MLVSRFKRYITYLFTCILTCVIIIGYNNINVKAIEETKWENDIKYYVTGGWENPPINYKVNPNIYFDKENDLWAVTHQYEEHEDYYTYKYVIWVVHDYTEAYVTQATQGIKALHVKGDITRYRLYIDYDKSNHEIIRGNQERVETYTDTNITLYYSFTESYYKYDTNQIWFATNIELDDGSYLEGQQWSNIEKPKGQYEYPNYGDPVGFNQKTRILLEYYDNNEDVIGATYYEIYHDSSSISATKKVENEGKYYNLVFDDYYPKHKVQYRMADVQTDGTFPSSAQLNVADIRELNTRIVQSDVKLFCLSSTSNFFIYDENGDTIYDGWADGFIDDVIERNKDEHEQERIKYDDIETFNFEEGLYYTDPQDTRTSGGIYKRIYANSYEDFNLVFKVKYSEPLLYVDWDKNKDIIKMQLINSIKSNIDTKIIEGTSNYKIATRKTFDMSNISVEITKHSNHYYEGKIRFFGRATYSGFNTVETKINFPTSILLNNGVTIASQKEFMARGMFYTDFTDNNNDGFDDTTNEKIEIHDDYQDWYDSNEGYKDAEMDAKESMEKVASLIGSFSQFMKQIFSFFPLEIKVLLVTCVTIIVAICIKKVIL